LFFIISRVFVIKSKKIIHFRLGKNVLVETFSIHMVNNIISCRNKGNWKIIVSEGTGRVVYS
jgi:hypothetical protein